MKENQTAVCLHSYLFHLPFCCVPILSVSVLSVPILSVSLLCVPILSVSVLCVPILSVSVLCVPIMSLSLLCVPILSVSVFCVPILSVSLLCVPTLCPYSVSLFCLCPNSVCARSLPVSAQFYKWSPLCLIKSTSSTADFVPQDQTSFPCYHSGYNSCNPNSINILYSSCPCCPRHTFYPNNPEQKQVFLFLIAQEVFWSDTSAASY